MTHSGEFGGAAGLDLAAGCRRRMVLRSGRCCWVLVLLALALAAGMGTAAATIVVQARASLAFDGAAPGVTQASYNHGTHFRSPPIKAERLLELTVSAWVKVERHKRYNWLVGTVNRDDGFALFTDEAEKACFGLFRGRQLKTISTRSLQRPKAWHFVSGVFRNGTIQVFVDAQPGETVPLSQPSLSPHTWKDGLLLGGAPDFAPLRLHGELGAVQVWDVARTAGELARDMVLAPENAAGGSFGDNGAGRQRGLVALWPSPGCVIPSGAAAGSNDAAAPPPGCEREGDSATTVRDVVGGQHFSVSGIGQSPTWRVADSPVYIHVVEGARNEAGDGDADDDEGAGARIRLGNDGSEGQNGGGKGGNGGFAFTLSSLGSNPGVRVEAFLENDANETLGRVPALPWPLVKGRGVKFSVARRASAEEEDLCSRVTLQMAKDGGGDGDDASKLLASQPLYLAVHPRDQPADYAGIVASCHFSGHDQNLVRRRKFPDGSEGEGARKDLSLVLFLPPESGPQQQAERLDEIAAFVGQIRGSLAMQCLVFNTGKAELAVRTETRGQDAFRIYDVRSVREGLKIAQAVSSGERTMLAALEDAAGALSGACSAALQRAVDVHAAGGRGPKIFSVLPSWGRAEAVVCFPARADSNDDDGLPLSRSEGEEPPSGDCEPIDQRAYANTVVSAMGIAPKWWPLFVPNALTFVDTRLFRAVKLGPEAQSRDPKTAAALLTVWECLLGILRDQDQAWEKAGEAAEAEEGEEETAYAYDVCNGKDPEPAKPGLAASTTTLPEVLLSFQTTLR